MNTSRERAKAIHELVVATLIMDPHGEHEPFTVVLVDDNGVEVTQVQTG